ncbi:nucleotide exchange factor GrpE [Vampirovibrio sp.]|uniref:nucleotide exchange factor GrpE n=1 Tax=Vampirovibrio sp. TaxID=2717857 RepID=UPI0035945989
MFNKSAPRESQERESQEMESSDIDTMSQPQAVAGFGENSEPEAEQSEWQGKYQLLQDQFTRLAADFDNYRKRTRDEQESLVKYGAQKSIMELLPVLDNLERATGSLSESSDPKLLYKSFSMMRQQLMDGLDNMGVTKIKAVGQQFDPLLHEAVNQMASAEFSEDTVMHEAQSGYQLHDKVIRPAMVVVSTGAPQADTAQEAPTALGAEAEEKPRNPFVK